MVESSGLLNRRRSKDLPEVRILSSPPEFSMRRSSSAISLSKTLQPQTGGKTPGGFRALPTHPGNPQPHAAQAKLSTRALDQFPKSGAGVRGTLHSPPVFRPNNPATAANKAAQAKFAAQTPRPASLHYPPVFRPNRPAIGANRAAQAKPANFGFPPVFRPGSPMTPARFGPLSRSAQMRATTAAKPVGGGRSHGAVQAIMAYRVEYPESYKIHLNERGKIIGMGSDDDFGISISFGLPDHSEHFVQERGVDQQEGLRVVSWEFNDDCYAALAAKASKAGSGNLAGRAKTLYGEIKNLPGPSWSDGANLNTYTKKTALSFNDKRWFPFLLAGSKNAIATVEFPEAKQKPEPKPATVAVRGTEVGWGYLDDWDQDDWAEMSAAAARSTGLLWTASK